jgi:hypothetical protein
MIVLIMHGVTGKTEGAPKPDLWPIWEAHNEKNDTRVEHGPWASFLRKYVVDSHPSGINRVAYAEVSAQDKAKLAKYLDTLQDISVFDLNRDEQKAFWINLYNALTVKIVLDHYPVASIRDIDISPGWFSNGPWGAELITVEGHRLTLDDIEHRILRPIWKDPRIHYAVNCASLGCPNLQRQPFTRKNMEALLRKAAAEYVNHERGVKVKDKGATLSSIYDWFQVDFGGSEGKAINHLEEYAHDPLKAMLKSFDGKIRYDYDWALNSVE